MATQPKLVNKQFNSPIGLYSRQNIQEVLDRETQILANGAVGINFQNPEVGKPANLKNSAVLRMLEEEENRQRNGIGPGAKRVAWPPPGETGSDSPYVEQNAVSAQGGPQYSPQSPGLQQNNYQAPAQQRSVPSNLPSNRPLKPLDVSTGTSSPLSSPLLNQSPSGFRSATPSKGWAPVHSPVATPSPPSWQQPSSLQYQQPSTTTTTTRYQTASPQLQQQSSTTTTRYQTASPSLQQQSSTTTTRFQTAHQSVSQQTYLGQQYFPTSQQYQQSGQQQYQPSQQQYQSSQQQYQSSQQQYQSPQQQYQSPQLQNQSQQPQQQSQLAKQQYQPPQQQYQPSQQQYQPPQQQYQAPQQQNQSQQQYQPTQQQYQPSQQQYQPSQQQYQASQQQVQPSQQQYQPPQQQYQSPQQQYQQNQTSQPSQSAPLQAAAPSQVAPRAAPASRPAQPPPPSTITLRPNAPVSQAPPPVVTSQPATATLKGGKHLRGDLKWPPETVKQQFEEENRLRLELARGPAVRPLRPNKDYTEFFGQHALNSTYPGYKIPPGTQFFRPV